MSKKINILVTGCGSMMGYGAVKILSTSSFVNRVFAGNTSSEFPARIYTNDLFVYPDFYFSKKSTKGEFIQSILEFCIREDIRIIIPCSIFELELFSENKGTFKEHDIDVIVESEETISIFFDKLRTAVYLNSLIKNSSPRTVEIVDNRVDLEYPYIVKPRYGYGSKGVVVVKNVEDYMRWIKNKSTKFDSYVAQEYLDAPDYEYSCSVLYYNAQPFSICAVRRQLKNGDTVSAIYDSECRDVEEKILPLASKVNGLYCLNFQLRMLGGIPFVFEVNPRFAASESIRTIFGQNPYSMLISKILDIPLKETARTYGKVVRVFEEILLK